MVRWRRQTLTQWRAPNAVAATSALLLDVLVLAVVLFVLPAHFDAPLDAILAAVPDAPLIAWPLLALAGIWGPMRTAAFVLVYLRNRPRAAEGLRPGHRP